MSEPLRIKLDRTLCDGFGICARHAPDYFSLDDWGYAVLVGDGNIPEQHRDAVRRALLDCPVHAILEIGERRPDGEYVPDTHVECPHHLVIIHIAVALEDVHPADDDRPVPRRLAQLEDVERLRWWWMW